MLGEARAALNLDLDQVLIPCPADNIASARTIERNGGVLEGIRHNGHHLVRRYWITLTSNPVTTLSSPPGIGDQRVGALSSRLPGLRGSEGP